MKVLRRFVIVSGIVIAFLATGCASFTSYSSSSIPDKTGKMYIVGFQENSGLFGKFRYPKIWEVNINTKTKKEIKVEYETNK